MKNSVIEHYKLGSVQVTVSATERPNKYIVHCSDGELHVCFFKCFHGVIPLLDTDFTNEKNSGISVP